MTSAADIEALAAHWLVRSEAPHVTNEELAARDEWLNADPRHRAAYLRLEAAWRRADILRRLRPIGDGPQPDLLQRVAAGLRREPDPKRAAMRRLGAAMAASLLIAAGASGIWSLIERSQWKEYRTEFGGFARIVLPDESVVYLNADSAMRVRYGPAKRQVILERGEALFNVRSDDRKRTFYVEVGDTVLRALGTAFAVRMHEREHVEVLVTEGQVAISAPLIHQQAKRGASTFQPAALPGDWVTITPERINVVHAAAAQVRQRLGWINQRVWFERQSLAQVVAEFNRYNRDQIVVADPSIAELQLGGAFDAADIDSFVAALARTFGIHATISTHPDSQARSITLSGPGSPR